MYGKFTRVVGIHTHIVVSVSGIGGRVLNDIRTVFTRRNIERVEGAIIWKRDSGGVRGCEKTDAVTILEGIGTVGDINWLTYNRYTRCRGVD